MKELIIVPGIMLLILGFAVHLEEIARQTSDKALVFADDMNDAMDCATIGRPIRECSPGLFTTDFSSEVNETMTTLSEFESEIHDRQ